MSNEQQTGTAQATAQDDGSLAFLAIPQDETNKHFNCKETKQQQLTNLTFWVEDFIENVKTKFGNERFLVKIRHDEPIPSGHEREEKFFTNSTEIKYILKKIKERKAFPRRVSMRASGTRYYFE